MSSKIFITGIGTISAIGKNVAESLESLQKSKTGIGKINYIKTRHTHLAVGEVGYDDKSLLELAKATHLENYSRTSLLGMIAAREALENANIENIKEFKTGLVSATSVGGMGVAENHFMEYLENGVRDSVIETAQLLDCSDSTEKIAASLEISDFISTISTACSSSANAIMYGARLIKNHVLDRVIVGGTDSLSRFTINGFNSLKILDNNLCSPFDAERNGLNLGEGAGYLVLESEKTVRNKIIYGELSGYGNANDAYHQTASSPDGAGAFLAMEKAIEMSGLLPSQINYVNAHGTGTELNDLSEGLALQRIFQSQIPPVSSTKAFTGHTLAAAGGIEAVLSILALKEGIIFPNLNFKTPMQELNFIPVTKLVSNFKINHVLSNSFGFGGNTSSLIFSNL